MKPLWYVSVASLALGTAFSVSARGQSSSAAPAGIRAELASDFSDVEKKLVDLAGAIPQEKYGWRPGAGVRSVSEVYMHVAGGNYYILSFAGVKPPETFDRGMEKSVTERAKVVEALHRSFDHVRTALAATSDADLDRKVKLFGRDATVRSAYVLLLNHAHEHMGQSIAYARMNGVTPPWSEAPPK
jgi:uncharacterized damage-inducible protein DinB